MKTLTFAYSERVTGENGYKHICVSTDKQALERHRRETTNVNFSFPNCEVMCDDETYKWIEDRQINGVLVLDEKLREEIKSKHFYKEIIML